MGNLSKLEVPISVTYVTPIGMPESGTVEVGRWKEAGYLEVWMYSPAQESDGGDLRKPSQIFL
jgi:hypothetical protein